MTPEHRQKISASLKGHTVSREARERLGASRRNEKHPMWKGDQASKRTIHQWVERHWSRSGVCADCGHRGKTDWSNVDHSYRRVRGDWAERCRSCHRRYDYARARALREAA